MAEYYYRDGERVSVMRSSFAFVVSGHRSADGERASAWSSLDLGGDRSLVVAKSVLTAIEERAVGDRLSLVAKQLVREELKAGVADGIRALPEPPIGQGSQTTPVLIERSGGLLLTVAQVVVSIQKAQSRQATQSELNIHGLKVIREISYVPNGYLCEVQQGQDPLAAANELVESGIAAFAHPVFIQRTAPRQQFLGKRSARPTGVETRRNERGTQFGARITDEWHLFNFGQNGASKGVDIGVRDAWKSTFGDPNISVAVIDSGVTMTHDVFGPGKVKAARDFAEADQDPTPTTSSHGTSCAALAVGGAIDGEMLGVAPLCRLVAVRRSPLSDHVSLSDALVWAADQGADIISCSWGIDGQPWVLPDVARAALQYVSEKGRGGLGAPIFWAAGNGYESVSTDEWVSSEYTIAVAASTDLARHATYSDSGPEISICAPSSGGQNGIATADNAGYTVSFGGTSAAAPIAAGVGALVLSVDAGLTRGDVEEILRRTARKIGAADSYDAAGHSHDFGYGQIDAGAAVAAARTFRTNGATERTQRRNSQLASFATNGTHTGAAKHNRRDAVTTPGMETALSSILDQLFKENPTVGDAFEPGATTGYETEPGATTANETEPGATTANEPEPGSAAPSAADILKICMYSQSVPVITQEALLQMEADLPRFVELLRGLAGRPTAMAQFKQFANQVSESGSDTSSELLAHVLGAPQSIGDNEERVAHLLALVAVVIAASALGYDIGHNWKR